VDACARVLESLVDGLSLDGDGAWLLLDVHDLSVVSAKTETLKHNTTIFPTGNTARRTDAQTAKQKTRHGKMTPIIKATCRNDKNRKM
jgi:hypothetical protein